MNCVLNLLCNLFLLALVAPFSRGCASALLGEYVPSFPQGFFFRVFVSGGYTSNQCQPIRHTQGLRLLIMCPSWKADWVSGLFFHDLGRIHASLSHLPRCSKVTYLGLVVF